MSYSKEQIKKALELYQQCKSVSQTVRILGYPTRENLYKWIKKENVTQKERKKLPIIINSSYHPRNPPIKTKLDAIKRCFELGESVKYVSEDIGYSRASIYQWRKIYLLKGKIALMNRKDNIKREKLLEGKESSFSELESLKEKIFSMQLEIDILKETIDVLKKDQGINLKKLTNKEKLMMINTLKNKYSLPLLLKMLELPKSSYYYHKKNHYTDKYVHLKKQIKEIFKQNRCCFGYRRIHALLKREGIKVSEKIIRRIMKAESLVIKVKKYRKYNSYKGEISPEVPNLINRNFQAGKPNEKWLTDISEFAIPAGKIYLSPIIDCFDGKIVSWEIGEVPNSKLVNDMLKNAISQLKENETPILHTDRGCHYRWKEWINLLKEAKISRSMSKKGCSPDNSACEGFFGRIKNEMFYSREWSNVSLENFKIILNDYLMWYNSKRIKISLGFKSPEEYRQSLGLI